MNKTLLIASISMVAATICTSLTNAETIVPSEISNSGCTRAVTTSIYDDEDTGFLWSYSYSDSKLTLVWYNLETNCCPQGFGSQIDKEYSNLKFSVWPILGEELCDCLCTFNITSTYEGIEPGHYTISFVAYNQAIHTVEIDLYEGAQQEISMPSGIRELSSDNEILSITKDGLLKVDVEESAIVEIYDLAGQRCAKLNIPGSTEISLNSLSSGVYIAKVKFNSRTVSLRFLR